MASIHRTVSTQRDKEPRRKKRHLKAAFLTWPGMAWHCRAWHGEAAHGSAWPGMAWEKGGGPMNRLPFQQQVEVVSLLIEGNSLRATARLTGVDRNTIMRLNRRVGEACHRLHHARMRDLQCARLELDETWSFVGKKQGNVQDGDLAEYGDAYLWLALDVHTRLIISYLVGKRTAERARAFVADVRGRVVNRPQIVTDAFTAYEDAVEAAFGTEVDYVMMNKQADQEQADRDDAGSHTQLHVSPRLRVQGDTQPTPPQPTPPQPTTTGPVPILSPSTSRPDPEPDPSSSAVVRSGRGTGAALPLSPLSGPSAVRSPSDRPARSPSPARLASPTLAGASSAVPLSSLRPILRLPRPPCSGGPPTASGALGPTPGLAAWAGVLVPRSAAITPTRAALRSVADATERHPEKEAPRTRTGGGGRGRGRDAGRRDKGCGTLSPDNRRLNDG